MGKVAFLAAIGAIVSAFGFIFIYIGVHILMHSIKKCIDRRRFKLKKIVNIEKAEKVIFFKDRKGNVLFSLQRGGIYSLSMVNGEVTFMYFGCQDINFKFRASKDVLNEINTGLACITYLEGEEMYLFF